MAAETTGRAPSFDAAFQARLYELFAWRRDVRRFRTDPVEPALFERILAAACLAPSVGLSQPWRFVTVDDPARRAAIVENFSRCNAEALADYGAADAARYAKLKLDGLREAPLHLAVYADEAGEQGSRPGSADHARDPALFRGGGHL